MSKKTKIIRSIFLFLAYYCLLTNPTQAQSVPIEVSVGSEKEIKSEITKVEVSGNTIFPPSEIKAVIANYPNPILDLNDLLKIAQRLTKLYFENGYITSGAYVPRQKIVDRVAKIQILEGKLEKIEIKGRENLQEKFILSHFSDLDSPLNFTNLEQQLRKLERNPSTQKVKGRLVKGSSPLSSVLLLEIEESPPFQTTFIFNNYRSPSIGEYQGILTSSYSNLIGIGERFYGQYSLTEGFDDYSIGFSLPLNAIDGIINMEYREGDSRIIESFLREADIRIESDTFSLLYRQAIVESAVREVAVSFGFEHQEEQTFLLGKIPFSFNEGAEEGRSVTSVISLTGEWIERSSTSVLAISSQLRFGIDFWDATVNEDAPDGIFTSWRGNIQWIKALNEERDLLFVFRVGTQLTPDSLLNSQKFSIGGAETIRGTRQNEELGDNGVVGSLELYIPLYKSSQNQNSLNLIPFVDGGIVWENEENNLKSLMSIGVGLSWNFSGWGRLRLDYGVPLIQENNGSNDSLQENGLTFLLEIKPF